jgi:hypothetical protein
MKRVVIANRFHFDLKNAEMIGFIAHRFQGKEFFVLWLKPKLIGGSTQLTQSWYAFGNYL